MTHAGQSSARARRAKIAKIQGARFARVVDDLIWEQTVKHHDPTPSWVRPAILIGGLLVSLAWIGAIAHGCGS